ncbi:MAG: hypothetical protein V3V11_06345 [Vicinamibacteria bacterium]
MRLPLYLVLAVGLSACGPDPSSMPERLIGVWKAQARKYRDRSFKLQPDKVIFEPGEETSDTNIVIGIESREDDGRLFYNIDYLSPDGLEHTFSFHYEPVAGGVIALKNQSGIVMELQSRALSFAERHAVASPARGSV